MSTSPAPVPFDYLAFKEKKAELATAMRNGTTPPSVPEKPAEAAPPAVAESPKPPAPPAPDDENDQSTHAKLIRSERRKRMEADRKAAQLEGRLQAMQEQLDRAIGGKAPESAQDPNAEPDRNAFKTEAEYTKALAIWAGKNAARTEALSNEQREAIRQRWEIAYQAAEEQKSYYELDELTVKGDDLILHETDNMAALIGETEFRYPILAYFAEHPEEFADLLEYEKDIQSKDLHKSYAAKRAQERKFDKIEAKAEAAFEKLKAEKDAATTTKTEPETPPAAPKKLTAAERDASKPKPSAALSVSGGKAPSATISMTLDDGVTLNPAWKRERILANRK